MPLFSTSKSPGFPSYSPYETQPISALAISTAFLTSGAILSLSYSAMPILLKLPAKQSLPHLRALFSSGSHIFPQAASLSSAGFAYLAYVAPPSSTMRFFNLVAAAGVISIAPYTLLVMKDTNMELVEIEKDEGAGLKKVENEKEGEEVVEKVGGEERVKDLMRSFQKMNAVRGGMMAFGAFMGLWAAMTTRGGMYRHVR